MCGSREEGSSEKGAPPSTARAAAQVFVEDVRDPVVEDDDAHHLLRVLRIRPGELVVAADGAGSWRSCRVRSAVADTALLEPVGDVMVCAAPQPAITVAFVPVKGDRPEWVVQKLTETGVDRIVVLGSKRSVVRWDEERLEKALERLRRVARGAAAQSRRSWLPELSSQAGPVELARSCPDLAMAEPGGGVLGAGLNSVAVGPEGGWEESELDLLLPTVGLGPNILRAETAALVAGVLLCARRDGVVDIANG